MPLGRPTSLVANAFIISAIASRFADWMRLDMPAVVLKAIPVLLLMGAVWTRGRRNGPRRAICAGLLLSVIGDVLLAWPGDLFVPGLLAFLLAHVIYITSFTKQSRRLAMPLLVPFALVGTSVFLFLRPELGDLLVPVLIYVVAITVMGWRAAALAGRVTGGMAALCGAALFLLSDSLLAINKFGHSFSLASEAVMASYWAAQYWIARSAMPIGASEP